MAHLSPIQTMTIAAACTERIRLGCVVFVAPLHSPVHLGKDLSTLDQLSRSRIEVGVSTGGRGGMFSAFGVDHTSVVARFSEELRLMKALLTESRINFDGRFWQLKDAAMGREPFQSPIPRSGSAPVIRMRCSAPPGTATDSSVPDRPRRHSSPRRCRSCGRRSLTEGGTPAPSGSPSASILASTMARNAPASESPRRCTILFVLRVD